MGDPEGFRLSGIPEEEEEEEEEEVRRPIPQRRPKLSMSKVVEEQKQVKTWGPIVETLCETRIPVVKALCKPWTPVVEAWTPVVEALCEALAPPVEDSCEAWTPIVLTEDKAVQTKDSKINKKEKKKDAWWKIVHRIFTACIRGPRRVHQE